MLAGKFAEGTLKWVFGGDRLRARRLYEHAQEFQPAHKLWLAVNRLPTLRFDDGAAWSRLRVIPFDVSFANSANRELNVDLQRELMRDLELGRPGLPALAAEWAGVHRVCRQCHGNVAEAWKDSCLKLCELSWQLLLLGEHCYLDTTDECYFADEYESCNRTGMKPQILSLNRGKESAIIGLAQQLASTLPPG